MDALRSLRRRPEHNPNRTVTELTEPQSRAARREQREARATRRARKRGEKPSGKKKSTLREWLDAMIFAIIFMVIVRTLLFDLFRIPTPSMEKNLLVGDYLFVSKLHYGTRTPMSLGIPFTQIHVRGLHLPWARFPGFSSVRRGDAVVFNWPGDQTDHIDRKMHYIKRVVGMPGDTLAVSDKVVHINGEPQPINARMQQHWYVYTSDPRVQLPMARLREVGITEMMPTANPSVVRVLATETSAQSLKEWTYVDRVIPAIARDDGSYQAHMYPAGQDYTPDNYGPVYIPGEGMTIPLTAENWPVLEPVIRKYEGRSTGASGETFLINGEPATSYTFTQDYYFMMGDNRDNSEDSRFWGFVPFDHIVGKAILVYFSWDADGSPVLVGQIRFGRLLSTIR